MKSPKRRRLTDLDNPQFIDQRNWYYRPCGNDGRYFMFIHEVFKDGVYIQTDQFQVPMRILRASLLRAMLRNRKAERRRRR